MSGWTIRLDGSESPTKEAAGGKAWSIARMRGLGLPVPPAFVIGTKACLAFLDSGDFPAGLAEEIDAGLAWLESETGRSFGAGEKRLLLSVRSGAAISMPGMMDTVLNLGIDDAGEAALAAETGLAGFARDTHRRFLELYASIVLKAPVELEGNAAPGDWRAAVEAAGGPVPASVRDQLLATVRAVFESWNTRRARRYREHNNIPHDLGTAVTIQAMVFGNLDERSGTGVLFSRNPLTGEAEPYGEYLPRAQGEDVVSGKFTPLPLDAMATAEPEAHAALLAASDRLEREHGDVQDIEFTVQSGQLYLLQSRAAKRAPAAAVRFAVDMVAEGRIDPATALSRVSAEQVRTLLLPRLSDGATDGAAVLATGEGACPGAATGVLVADADEAERRAAAGEDVILVRKTTSPDDVHGMIAARAVVTEQGGSTSHAAVVSRALGRPCVVGVGDGAVAKSGTVVTVDGAGGLVYAGTLATEAPNEQADARLRQLIEWARAASPVAVVDFAAGPDGFDVDRALAAGDAEALAGAIGGASVVRGHALANDDIARIARGAGATTIVTEPILPVLLTMIGDAA
ncbi:pyruvate, phosphate dikinase [Sphingopyxis macrogoltabida]|uniref:Pyruvate phosphate dikinase n=1 Tax=Sphingopyxis macrogoltabida TaxID=33050 RepID=A0A0N9UZ84_SPHMC|nr:pyruvate, phosphate dikinase [Sphingopyxis macrogoltabida]ALH80892.1 pyruvate phosphate dikinase [Sphingopyxis macrogoltabida]